MTNKSSPWTWFNKELVSIEIEAPIVTDPLPLPSIVLIHGANQSNVSFEYLRHALPGFHYINIDWNTMNGFHNNLDEMVGAISTRGPVYIVGHSMGCIYAAHLSQQIECIGGAALSAPWGGSKAADWARYMMPNYPLYKEVGTKSDIIISARNFKLPGRWTNYVSTLGNVPGMGASNDCVLTIDSMSAKKDIPSRHIKATHYEILMSSEIVHSIGKNFLKASGEYQNNT
jgi:pimeloyl-ACP methyl ester carboxylesterase